jgi:hypothetical protein
LKIAQNMAQSKGGILAILHRVDYWNLIAPFLLLFSFSNFFFISLAHSGLTHLSKLYQILWSKTHCISVLTYDKVNLIFGWFDF